MDIESIRSRLDDLKTRAYGVRLVETRSECVPDIALEEQTLSCLIELANDKLAEVYMIYEQMDGIVYNNSGGWGQTGVAGQNPEVGTFPTTYDGLGTFPYTSLFIDYKVDSAIFKFKRDYPVREKRWMETVKPIALEQIKPYRALYEVLMKR